MNLSSYSQIVWYEAMYNSNMNEMYKAIDKQTGQAVIIKARSKKASDNPQRCIIFEKEIELALRLKDPHILYPLGDGEDTFPHYPRPVRFIVYSLMRDGSLEDLMRRYPVVSWPLVQIASVILQAASALMYMHTQTLPIVHCDVKPDNFLIQCEPASARIAHLFLIDFGIACTLRPDHEKGTPRGTAPFMAPEQFRGDITCQTDQYALALIACYLLTGKYPLQPEGDTWRWRDWKRVHTHFAPYAPSKLNPRRIRSKEIDAIILKALEKEPERRFSTIWDFAVELAHAIEGYSCTSLPEALMKKLAPPTTVIPECCPIPLQQVYQTEEQPEASSLHAVV